MNNKKLLIDRFLRSVFTSVVIVVAAVPAAADSVLDLPVPLGYTRVEYASDSFSGWMQRLPLKDNNSVLTYLQTALPARLYDRLAVLNKPLIFDQDLEQCADFCMRLWADYHAETDRLDELFLFDYSGNKLFYKDANVAYPKFLHNAFAYANSHSLKQGGLDPFSAPLSVERGVSHTPRPGDMIVQNDTGGIGHVSMIVDESKSADGDRLYLIGFSFMPAQEFHIERAPTFDIQGKPVGKDSWFSYEGYVRFLNEFYPYGDPVLRRFDTID